MTHPSQPTTPLTAWIGIGSNLGDRARNIADAIARLTDPSRLVVKKVSTLLENPAVGGPADSPGFLNAAIEVQTTLRPRELLNRMLETERQLGRDRRQKWEPRPIDLDLLLFGSQIISEPDLQVPHPLMHARRFVLQPLAEIAPQALHPLFGKSIQVILSELNSEK